MFSLPLILAFVPLITAFDWDEPTELDFYVHSDDGYFEWEELDMYEYEGVDVYMLNMTSQKWFNESFSSRPVWWHIMAISIPHEIEFDDVAMLGIKGGNNRLPQDVPGKDDVGNVVLAWYSNNTNIVAGYIDQVPNQPIVFPNDPEQKERSEDDFIAWTWVEAEMTNGTVPEMLARFPMTKAAKRGLDTIHEFIMGKIGNNITRFLAGGASKRGWTTWSLAAMDRRVMTITPLVFSLLNMGDTLMHHYKTMDGAWSFAFSPYWNVNLTQYLLDPLADLLYDYEDMYRYRERLTMPKLIISAAGDEFFFLSDSHHWWNDMLGENRFMMNPNAEHTLFPHWVAIARNIAVFTKSVLREIAMPQVTWERQPADGRIVMNTDTEPLRITGFRAQSLNNHTRRDFRLAMMGEDGDIEAQNVLWTRKNVTEIPVENGFQFELIEDEVDDVWVGAFIQAEFEGLDGFDYRFTTEVNIIPDTFPRDDCTTGSECFGYLV